jgi:ribonuclease HII
MRDLAGTYPGFNFEANKGYPCPVHKAALQAWGPTTLHRRSWIFMDHLMWNGITRFVRPDNQLQLPL